MFYRNFFQRRRAFTLVELLVVIAIIGVAGGAAAAGGPAGPRGSQAVNARTTSSNWALALSNYEDARKYLPPTDPQTTVSASLTTLGFSPQARLLPFLDLQAICGPAQFHPAGIFRAHLRRPVPDFDVSERAGQSQQSLYGISPTGGPGIFATQVPVFSAPAIRRRC